MNHLPLDPLSPESQQRVAHQMYALMEKQVQSYHRHRQLGSHSSVSSELAQELMASILYTVSLTGGVYSHKNLEEALSLGQEVLKTKLHKGKALLELVHATAPRWQTECRWDALRYLGHYLANYDSLHLAHQAPEGLFYPILISQPGDMQGMDVCLIYLNIMWIENQIMAAIPEAALEAFWSCLPAAALNQCEYLLINGMGKVLLGTGLDSLVLQPDAYIPLTAAMMNATEATLRAAAHRLCHWLDLKNESAGMYVQSVVPQLSHWIGDPTRSKNISSLFLFQRFPE